MFDTETGPQLDFNATDARPRTPPAVTRGPGAQPILVDGFPDLDGLPLDEQEQLLLERQELLEQQFKQLQEQVSCYIYLSRNDVTFPAKKWTLVMMEERVSA